MPGRSAEYSVHPDAERRRPEEIIIVDAVHAGREPGEIF
jgi:Ni,Fe-hydrogenase maturation factor